VSRPDTQRTGVGAPDPAGARSGAATAVSPGSPEAPGRGSVTERVAAALLAHPAVASLSGGEFGTIATYLPGRRVPGVVLGEGGEATRVAVVLHFGAPVVATAQALRRIVATETGATRVDVVVTDLELPV
jgi:hypothetical protein